MDTKLLGWRMWNWTTYNWKWFVAIIVAVFLTWGTMRSNDLMHQALGFWGDPWEKLQNDELCFSGAHTRVVCVQIEYVVPVSNSMTLIPVGNPPIWDPRYRLKQIGFTTFAGGGWFFKVECAASICDNDEIEGAVAGRNGVPVIYHGTR